MANNQIILIVIAVIVGIAITMAAVYDSQIQISVTDSDSATYCSNVVSSEAHEIYMNQKIAVTKTLEDIQHVRNQQIPITHELGTTKSVYLHDLFETKYSPEFYEDIYVMENSSFSVTSIDANGVDAFWMENNSENVLLYFHGGAYLFGSPLQPQPFVISALSQNNLNVLTIDYRLVPEYSYPAAIEDGKSSYHYLHRFMLEKIVSKIHTSRQLMESLIIFLQF